MENATVLNLAPSLVFDDIKTRFATADEDDLLLLRGLFEKALAIARPKAIFRSCSVKSIEGDRVTIDNQTFKSAVLANNLKDIHRAFAYVVTCGTEVDDWSHEEKDDIIRLWLDMMKEMILGSVRGAFITHLRKVTGIDKFASMGPGTGNAEVWPISQQKPLFELISGVTEKTGTRLTDSFLMLPTKSVSGILYPTEVTFVTCSLCDREHCIGRHAPYDEKMAAALQEV